MVGVYLRLRHVGPDLDDEPSEIAATVENDVFGSGIFLMRDAVVFTRLIAICGTAMRATAGRPGRATVGRRRC